MLVEIFVVWRFCIGKNDAIKKHERSEWVQNGRSRDWSVISV